MTALDKLKALRDEHDARTTAGIQRAQEDFYSRYPAMKHIADAGWQEILPADWKERERDAAASAARAELFVQILDILIAERE